MISVSVGVYLLDSFLGFHMDLLALFLGFHMDLLALCDGEISVLRRDTTLHYTVCCWGGSTLLNQAPMLEGHDRPGVWLGVFSVRGSNNGSNRKEAKVLTFFFCSCSTTTSTLAFDVNLV